MRLNKTITINLYRESELKMYAFTIFLKFEPSEDHSKNTNNLSLLKPTESVLDR